MTEPHRVQRSAKWHGVGLAALVVGYFQALSLMAEQLFLATHALAHGQRVHLVFHRAPHPHQLLPMPD
ncbi:MAG: hypothetical protein ACRD2S_08535, partial [Terriglobales bacterium]